MSGMISEILYENQLRVVTTQHIVTGILSHTSAMEYAEMVRVTNDAPLAQIEVNVMPGKGEFLLTGQLGDVMKESAQAGISFIRSVAEQYKIPKEFFEKHDIHIHIPEGAVPKDGPSAGITMATAMVSAITKVPVKADVAMTGEITLRGRVLPIGGLKEKLLAAKKAGIHMVLVPEKNEPDVRELDAEITDGLQIEFVGSMEQVLKLALVEKK
jgi:ATP-dependent Lon protease